MLGQGISSGEIELAGEAYGEVFEESKEKYANGERKVINGAAGTRADHLKETAEKMREREAEDDETEAHEDD